MRKRAFIWMMSLMLVFSMLPLSAAAASADSATSNEISNTVSQTIYVAATGDDSTGDGSQAKPYKTIAKAKEIVRTLPKTGGDIVVQIADGFYSLDETLVFDKNDSGSASSTIRYEAAPGAKPVISAGEMLDKGVWTEAVGLTHTNGLTAYKTTLERSDKLRAIYVNDKRANMTLSPQIVSANRTVNGTPTVSFTGADNDWAWRDGNNIRAGIVFDASVGLKADTKNPQNIEAESMGGSTARWARPFVTFASIEQAPEASGKPGGVMLRFQMPYGAISQSLSNNTQYNPGNNQVIRNAFEFFNKRGDFYFDQAESTLYYIPLEGEDIHTADVVIPRLETVLDIRGIPVGDRLSPVAGSDDGRVKHITFKGLRFAHTDYKLFELTGTYTLSDGSGKVTSSSRGYASVQGSIVNTVYFPSSINWHETFYRGYDIPPAAVMINGARNIKVLDGDIMLTGFNGIHIENDVKDIEVTGNYIADTLASGIVIGHPHHIYENDKPEVHESRISVSGTPIRSWAGVDKEKFKSGTEAVPENIYITNNFLFRNCYGFPGANSLASFYTTNMQVLHNYFYDSTYGAMSIGWGWDEYDGFGFTAQGTNKTGGPYHGTHETSLARSPEITTTSRNNKISYNRVEEICTVVNDSGAIYSLGRQGDPGTLPDGGTWDTINTLTNNPVTDKTSNWHPDNWTNYTEMNYNFLDPNPTGKPTTSNNWTNGFHPDEGSTFIKMIGNVVQSKLSHAPGQSRLFEFNNWKRKSDMIAIDGYVDGNNNQNGAPRITYDNYKSEARIWPLKGNEIVLNSGLKNEYTHMIPRSLIADTEFELASNVIMGNGGTLKRRGLLQAQDTVWLAPANTTAFGESNRMTKAAGDAKTIKAPSAAGEYKLYIVYADGRATATSKHTVYVDQSASAINVEDGQSYEVSSVRPLELTLSGEYSYTLNGNPVASGYKIATEGSWTLVVSTPANPNEMTIQFTTTVSVANKLLPADVNVAPGGKVRFAIDLDDATKKIWISSSSGGHFDGGDDESVASGDAIGMNAPMVPGPYIIYVLAEDGEVLSQSHTRVVVSDTTLADIPRNGLDLWLKADEGVERDSSGNVTGWTNMGSVPAKLVPANVPGSGGDNLGTPNGNPAIKKDVYDYVEFAANSRPLKAAGFKDYNGSTEMTIYTLVRPTTTANNSSDQNGLVYFGLNEAYQTWAANDGWSGINLGVGTNRVNIRFGNADGSVSGGGQQITTTATDDLVSVRAQLNGTHRAVFVNNNVIGTPGTNAKALAGNRSDLGVGYSMSASTPFRFLGRVSQILIYDRVLTADEITKVEAYFNEVKVGRGGSANPIDPTGVDKTLLTDFIGAVNNLDHTKYTMDSWNVFASALSEAQTAASDDEIGQDSADNAYYALRNAFKALQVNQEQENAELGGPSTVIAGHPIHLSVGIDNLVTGIDAFSVEVNYDPAKFEFETRTDDGGVVSLADRAITNVHPDLSILATAVKPQTGQILIIASTKGSLYQDSGELFVLNGSAASSAAAGGTSVSLSDFVVTAQASARNINVEEAVLDIQVRLTDGSGLAAIIEQAQELLSAATEGTQPGQYPVGSKARLQEAIQAAIQVRDDAASTESDIAQAITALNQAISVFRSSVIADPNVNKAELIKAIDAAKAKLGSVEEGTKIGQYSAEAIDALEAAIQRAEAVKNDGSASQSTVNQAVTALHEAVQDFAAGIITLVPGQTAVTILDLSFLAKYYGTKSSDPDWVHVEKADLFDSGEITIRELSAVARMIVENWLSE
ncbi:cohesin domain-containing protein [Paenibacillus sp. 1P07SE]|uniref:cohesin domain-containing protein n=1 Tax=Paenibacillus sp. 1P07SE TaxID=3132209 RepID=UPI0039A54063